MPWHDPTFQFSISVGAVEKVFLTAKHAKVCAKDAEANH